MSGPRRGRKPPPPPRTKQIPARSLEALCRKLVGLDVATARRTIAASAYDVRADFLADDQPYPAVFRSGSIRVFVRDDRVVSAERG